MVINFQINQELNFPKAILAIKKPESIPECGFPLESKTKINSWMLICSRKQNKMKTGINLWTFFSKIIFGHQLFSENYFRPEHFFKNYFRSSTFFWKLFSAWTFFLKPESIWIVAFLLNRNKKNKFLNWFRFLEPNCIKDQIVFRFLLSFIFVFSFRFRENDSN